MALIVNVFQFNGFQENTYLVSNDSGETLIFDPGCYSREEELLLSDFIEKNKLTICAVLYTHAHIDHILGAEFVREKYKCASYLHPRWQAAAPQSATSSAHRHARRAWEPSF